MTKKRRKRHLLKLGSVDMISLVDRGDNPGARVAISKRQSSLDTDDEEGGKIPAMNANDDDRVGFAKRFLTYMGISKADLDLEEEVIVDKDAQELKKQLDELQGKFDDLEKETAIAKSINTANDAIAVAKSAEDVDKVIAGLEDVDVIKAVTDIAAARKGVLAKSADDEVVKAFREKLPVPLQKAFDEMEDDDQKSFMKSYDGKKEDPTSATLAKMASALEAANTRLEKVEMDTREAEIVKELEDLEGIIKSVPDAAKMIAKTEKRDPDAGAEMLEYHKALAAQAKEKDFLKVIGQDDGAIGDAEAELDKAVEKYRAEHPDVSEAEAMTKVLDADPELYDRYNIEKEAR